MKAAKEGYPFFAPMIEEIVTGGRFRPQNKHRNLKKLELVSEEDGRVFGVSFLSLLKTAATEEGAFNSLLLKHHPLLDFSNKHPFFKPLMMVAGNSLNHASTWKKLFLSAAAAGMSIFDIATDIYTILYYYELEKARTANLMLAFVSLSIFMQLVACGLIHYHDPKRMLVELLATLTFTKPGFNKFRVLTNKKMVGHELMPPVSELLVFKQIEVFAESIPVTVLQVFSLLEGEKIDWIVIGALLSR